MSQGHLIQSSPMSVLCVSLRARKKIKSSLSSLFFVCNCLPSCRKTSLRSHCQEKQKIEKAKPLAPDPRYYRLGWGHAVGFWEHRCLGPSLTQFLTSSSLLSLVLTESEDAIYVFHKAAPNLHEKSTESVADFWVFFLFRSKALSSSDKT